MMMMMMMMMIDDDDDEDDDDDDSDGIDAKEKDKYNGRKRLAKSSTNGTHKYGSNFFNE